MRLSLVFGVLIAIMGALCSMKVVSAEKVIYRGMNLTLDDDVATWLSNNRENDEPTFWGFSNRTKRDTLNRTRNIATELARNMNYTYKI